MSTLGIGVLSWRAHETLMASLESYQTNGFLDCFDQKLIYFSDLSDKDREIAARFGWQAAGGPNRGIAGGMKALAEHMHTDYVLLLQNDNPIVENADFAKEHLEKAVALLASGRADLARMRHRWLPGEGFSDVKKYLRYFPARQVARDFSPQECEVGPANYTDTPVKRLRRLLRPSKAKRLAGRAVFIEAEPHKVHPRLIRNAENDFYLIDSAALNFSDQCLLISREKWLNVFIDYVEKNPSSRQPNGFQAPEICINGPWWRKNGFVSAQGRGLFTHRRYDGSFRKEHHAYQESGM